MESAETPSSLEVTIQAMRDELRSRQQRLETVKNRLEGRITPAAVEQINRLRDTQYPPEEKRIDHLREKESLLKSLKAVNAEINAYESLSIVDR